MIDLRGDVRDLANLNDSSFTRPLGRTMTRGITRRELNRLGASALFQPKRRWRRQSHDAPSSPRIDDRLTRLLASPKRCWLRRAIHIMLRRFCPITCAVASKKGSR